jgi:hypothetical protein
MLVLVPLVLVGCGAARPGGRTEVELGGPKTAGRVEALSTSAACVITGPGELEGPLEHGGPFSLYSAPTSDEALVTVQRPSNVPLAWTDLPTPVEVGGPGGRARVRTGGGVPPLARVTGWASLEKRVFQLRREADIVPDHVWLDAGLDVEVRGFHAGRVYVTRRTYLVEPTEVVAMAHCADVAYEPKRLEVEATPVLTSATLESLGHRLHLRARPDGPVVYELAAEGQLTVGVVATKDAWRRVEGHLDRVRFDGWVLASELAPMTSEGHGRLGGSHRSKPPTMRGGRLMQVVRETPLLMGPDAATAQPVGILEVGAKLDVVGITRDGITDVRFYPALLVPPDGMLFFAKEADLLAQEEVFY